jgi:hypothetical protein
MSEPLLEGIVDEAARQQFQAMLDASTAQLLIDLEARAIAHINVTMNAALNQRRSERELEYAAMRRDIDARATVTTVQELATAQSARWRTSTALMIDKALDYKLNPFMTQLTHMGRDIASLSGAVKLRLSDRDEGLKRAERRIDSVASQTESRFSRLDGLISEMQMKQNSLENRYQSVFADIYGDVTAKDGQPSMMGTLRELLGEMKTLNLRIETIERENEQRRQLVQRFVGTFKAAPGWVRAAALLASGGGLIAILLDWLNQLRQ